jgi:hypothetical protein
VTNACTANSLIAAASFGVVVVGYDRARGRD